MESKLIDDIRWRCSLSVARRRIAGQNGCEQAGAVLAGAIVTADTISRCGAASLLNFFLPSLQKNCINDQIRSSQLLGIRCSNPESGSLKIKIGQERQPRCRTGRPCLELPGMDLRLGYLDSDSAADFSLPLPPGERASREPLAPSH